MYSMASSVDWQDVSTTRGVVTRDVRARAVVTRDVRARAVVILPTFSLSLLVSGDVFIEDDYEILCSSGVRSSDVLVRSGDALVRVPGSSDVHARAQNGSSKTL